LIKGKFCLFLLLVTSQFVGLAQIEKPPLLYGETNKLFNELVKLHKLSNLKAGLNFTAQRNDTLFVVFYCNQINNFKLLPLGKISDSLNINCYSDNVEANVFMKIRPNSNTICTQYFSKYEVNKEKTYIFYQTLSDHHTVLKSEYEDYLNNLKSRLIFYSPLRGIYKVEYLNNFRTEENKFQWPYIEGDFIF